MLHNFFVRVVWQERGGDQANDCAYEDKAGDLDLGYVEGQNITIEYRASEDDAELKRLATELIGGKIAILITQGRATVQAKTAAASLPHVFGISGDPIDAIGQSYSWGFQMPWNNFVNALVADAKTTNDATANATLLGYDPTSLAVTGTATAAVAVDLGGGGGFTFDVVGGVVALGATVADPPVARYSADVLGGGGSRTPDYVIDSPSLARDTPGFISTRIWITHLLDTLHLAIAQGLTVEEVDYLTGSLIGRPRSATFRMLGARKKPQY